MGESDFNEPRLIISRVYTKRGDSGETSLAGGQRLSKDSPRIEAYGTIDELNAFVASACLASQELSASHASLLALVDILVRVQHELFNLGSILATQAEDVRPKQPRVRDADIVQLEREIDSMNEGLPELRSFVLPGGSRLNVELHICRTVCRRAERLVVALARQETVPPEAVRYLNRLSDAFFVWSRWASHVMNVPETLWEPNKLRR